MNLKVNGLDSGVEGVNWSQKKKKKIKKKEEREEYNMDEKMEINLLASWATWWGVRLAEKALAAFL